MIMSSRGWGSKPLPKSTLLRRMESEPDASTAIEDFADQLDGTSPSYKQPERIQPLTTNPQSSGTADSTGANVNTNPSITHHDLTPKPSDIDQASPAPPPSASEAAHKLKAGEPLTAAEREELAEQGKLPHDPNDHSGEPMKMHGGISSDSEKSDRSKSVAHEGGGEHGKETGTGKEWVKTTGFSADGGNFDASKPGAGKEANRLLEEQGIKRGVGDPKLSPGVGLPTEEKKSLADKLREKLHIGGGKHV